ncbi:MAG TPA: HAMP domain-containing sensor histidine kinase [Chitinophaga sp.]|uniref:sensor histidine kinase n=1 Tax=Chitinophaga sp. TaxID=1869181 RepID=UPI002B71819A|nr:HAMP domain-containing sensor histidine kinase [Chitinophaga sp.]HVI48979.1 HAMP domain-containing sensor histidine kinase [Chitinophaga sp.]
MIPLKRIFPVIVVLITLTLLGIIYIQYNWIKNAIATKREQFNHRAEQMAGEVTLEMMNRQRMNNSVILRMNNAREQATFGLNRVPVPVLTQPAISEIYAPQEVRHLIQEKMKSNRLDTSHFEFAIFGSNPGYNGRPKMNSGGFDKMFAAQVTDSADYKIQMIILGDLARIDDRTETMMIILPNKDVAARQMTIMITGSVLFTLIIITAFALTIYTMLNQKKLSEIKSDFINNMTHELKTPLATISLAIDAIGNEKVMDNKDKIRYFSGIIKEENKRMNKQVESILQSALLEKDEIGLKLLATDVHAVIQSTTDNLQLQLAAKNGVVELQLDAINPVIMADDVHFSNVVFNLLDNAIKYSKDNLEIKIQTYNTRKSLFIVITDNGIGMSRDTISRIFEKFYRAHTGNVHNVKGFGLGLTYVKAIVDAHKGKIKVESTLGRGSKFTLEFPQE